MVKDKIKTPVKELLSALALLLIMMFLGMDKEEVFGAPTQTDQSNIVQKEKPNQSK